MKGQSRGEDLPVLLTALAMGLALQSQTDRSIIVLDYDENRLMAVDRNSIRWSAEGPSADFIIIQGRPRAVDGRTYQTAIHRLTMDCDGRRARFGSTEFLTLDAQRVKRLEEGSPDWTAAGPSSALEGALDVVCRNQLPSPSSQPVTAIVSLGTLYMRVLEQMEGEKSGS